MTDRQQDVDLSLITLIYRDQAGETHEQPITDLVHVGALIDPESGEELEPERALVTLDPAIGASTPAPKGADETETRDSAWYRTIGDSYMQIARATSIPQTATLNSAEAGKCYAIAARLDEVSIINRRYDTESSADPVIEEPR